VLRQEYVLHEFGYRHRRWLRIAARSLMNREYGPCQALSLPPAQTAGTGGWPDINGRTPPVLLEPAVVEQVFTYPDLPGVVLPKEIHVVWKSASFHLASG
jgi:hypothetical protein